MTVKQIHTGWSAESPHNQKVQGSIPAQICAGFLPKPNNKDIRFIGEAPRFECVGERCHVVTCPGSRGFLPLPW